MRGSGPLNLFVPATLCLSIPIQGGTQYLGVASTGLRRGVDNVNGSLRTVSIADLDASSVFEIGRHYIYRALYKGPGGLELMTGMFKKDGVLREGGSPACRSRKSGEFETIYEF